MEDLVLGVSIGPLDRDSLVQQPVPFPFQPREDAWLRVLVSSTDFIVGRDLHDLARGASGVEQSLLLPADGSPSLTEDGRPQLRFALRPRVFSTARARMAKSAPPTWSRARTPTMLPPAVSNAVAST